MIFSAACVAGMIFSVLSTLIWFRRKNVIEAAVMGIIMWFFSHILASMGLFLIDRYTIFRAACGAAVLSGAVLVLVVFLRRSRPFRWRKLVECDFSIKEMLIPILVSVMALPFVSMKNEYFGMGQDQGVYQTQAILFMNGDTKRQKNLDEYSELETDREREVFEYNAKNMIPGYDIQAEDYPETVYDRSISPVSGIIHGIPTYSALLAMWGTLFGMANMQGFETIIYACLIFLVFFISRNLKLKSITSLCACVCTAAAPVVIWVAKSSLTEMLLALIPAVFLYFMTDDDNPKQKWLSVIAIVIFGCYHVSIYTMMPMFVLIYGGMYVFTREKQYALLMPSVTAFYLASYFMMRRIQPMYTMNNYSPVFVGRITVHNITAVVAAVSAAAFIAVIVFALIVKKRTDKKFSSVKFSRSAAASKVFNVLLKLMLILPVLFITVRAFMKYGSWDEANHLTLLGFVGNAGIVLLPLGFAAAIAFSKYFAEKPQRLVLFLMFFYCIPVYSSFLRYEIQHYFYYSRYLAPFIPIAVLFCTSVLDRFGGKLMVPVTIAGLLYLVPFDRFLLHSKDDSRIEWSVLSDLADFVGEESCVVISPAYTSRLWLPVRSMTGAGAVPEDEGDPMQIQRLAARYGRVFVITEKKLDDTDYSLIYSNRLHCVEDDLNHTGRFIPMALEYLSTTEDIRVYSYDRYRFRYTAADDYGSMSGVSGLEGNFCWTDSEVAQVECRLTPADYDITLELGGLLPLDSMDVDSFEVTLTLGGEELGTEMITPENNGRSLHFRVSAEQIEEGVNILGISSPLWQAAVSNPDDSRTLGIPVRSVRFAPAS